MWDDQKHFYPGVIKFIKDVDGGTFKKGDSFVFIRLQFLWHLRCVTCAEGVEKSK
jgi:hypothetical protein